MNVTKQRLFLALGLCLVAWAARAQDVSNVARHAPADTCLAVASADVAGTCQAFQETRLGETLCGPAFAPLIDELRRRELAGPLNLQPAVGFDWSDLAEVHGAGGLFIFPVDEQKLGMAWIFSGAGSTESPGPLAAAQRYFTAQGFTRATERLAAGQLTLFTPTGKRKDEATRVAFVGSGFYGVANSRAAAEALLAVAFEGSLAGQSTWQQTRVAGDGAAQPAASDANFVLRPIALWDLLRRDSEERKKNRQATPAEDETEEEPQRDPLASARQLGFDGVSALAGRVVFSADAEHDWQLQATLVVPRPYEKALRLLSLQQGPLPELPDWIAEDVTSVSFWRWDFPLAMKGYGNLFDEANEPGPDGVGLFEDMLDGLRDDPEGVQVDLRRDVFELLGPTMINVTDRHGPQTDELPSGERTLYVAQVRDVPRLVDALKRFYRGDELVQHARRGDYEVWTVPEGSSLFVEGESDSVVFVRALAVGGGKMLFSTDVDMLDAALSSNPSGGRLKDGAPWSRLWQTVGQQHAAGAALCGLLRVAQVLEPSYDQAIAEERSDKEGMAAGLWRILLFGTADEEVDVPNAAAPPYENVSGGLPPASVVLSEAAEGFAITIRAAGGASQ